MLNLRGYQSRVVLRNLQEEMHLRVEGMKRRIPYLSPSATINFKHPGQC